MQEIIHVNILRLHSHIPHILKKMGGMGILFRIAVCMVHAVQDSIGPGVQEGRALGNKSEAVKESFPEFIHSEHLMRSIAVQEESLCK